MIRDREYFRGNMYIIAGVYVLYLAFKMFRERSMVIDSSPVLPWVFMVVLVFAGSGMIYIGAKALKKHKQAMKEAEEKRLQEEAEYDAAVCEPEEIEE